MIEKKDTVFFLNTRNTSYLFRVHPSGVLEHLYYGRKLAASGHTAALNGRSAFAPGNAVILDEDHPSFSLEELRMEYSSPGKGDIREPLVEAVFHDGSRTLDLRYASCQIHQGKSMPEKLPGCMSCGSVWELRIHLRDRMAKGQYSGLEMTLIYDVYEDEDVIVRRAVIHNTGEDQITLMRALSLQLDLPEDDYVFHSFGGPWTAEMQHEIQKVGHAKLINESVCGFSSNRSNPFTMLGKADTTENAGECWGFHLVYSGNHFTVAEQSSFGDVHIVCGISPRSFSWRLNRGENFETPEAVFTYSPEGYQGLSAHFHPFIREHVVRGKWKKKPRPILLNSWEAAYFKITQNRLLSMARSAKEMGIELFVMDDGWFLNRNDDTSSLGDWTADPAKLPNGIKGLSDKIHEMGLQFGLWVEPEMISEKSRLYEKHPDWAIRIPDRHHSMGRNQMLLDLTRAEVRAYILDSMRRIFSGAGIDYVKWDMNRIFSDVYSAGLPAERQGEVSHRYILGLYEILETLTGEFPEILFEGCAAGGCRFDLGILCYMPQIWASDNTDAYARAGIQHSLTYGYPPSVFTAHVSGSPNHQTLRESSLEARFAHAAFAVLGYECHMTDLSIEERKKLREQIRFYKKNRRLFQYGTFYRLDTDDGYRWMVVSPDRKKAIGMWMKGTAKPNHRKAVFRAKGLRENVLYRFTNLPAAIDVREFGSLVNTMSPVHIRQDSLAHRAIAAVVRMEIEKEDYLVPGDQLMHAGVNLKEAYSGTGYNDQVRTARDYETRIYVMEAVE